MKLTLLLLAACAALALSACTSTKTADPFDTAIAQAMAQMFSTPAEPKQGGAR